MKFEKSLRTPFEEHPRTTASEVRVRVLKTLQNPKNNRKNKIK